MRVGKDAYNVPDYASEANRAAMGHGPDGKPIDISSRPSLRARAKAALDEHEAQREEARNRAEADEIRRAGDRLSSLLRGWFPGYGEDATVEVGLFGPELVVDGVRFRLSEEDSRSAPAVWAFLRRPGCNHEHGDLVGDHQPWVMLGDAIQSAEKALTQPCWMCERERKEREEEERQRQPEPAPAGDFAVTYNVRLHTRYPSDGNQDAYQALVDAANKEAGERAEFRAAWLLAQLRAAQARFRQAPPDPDDIDLQEVPF